MLPDEEIRKEALEMSLRSPHAWKLNDQQLVRRAAAFEKFIRGEDNA